MLVLAGCGRVNFDERVDALDRCAAETIDLGTWSAPAPIAAINAGGEQADDPEPSPDGLELYFTSPRTGSVGMHDVWRVRRTTTADAWGPVQHVDELSSGANENTPALSSDGLEMWIASDRLGGATLDDLYVSTRPSIDAAWSTPVLVPELMSDDNDRGPSLFDRDLAMLFHSARGTGGSELFITRRAARGAPWSAPEKLVPPDTAGEELRGWISPCGLDLYFESSTRTGTGSMDFFHMTRATTDAPFSDEEEVVELDTPAFEQDLRLTPDRRGAYFASDRSGVFEIYETAR